MITDHDTLVLLDFGCAQSLSDAARHGYFRVLQACVVNDQKVIADTLTAMGFSTRSGNPDTLLAFVAAILDQVRNAIIYPDPDKGWPSPVTSSCWRGCSAPWAGSSCITNPRWISPPWCWGT